MKLTYRGIEYKSLQTEIETNQHNLKDFITKKDTQKVIQIRPINYYTYRGVSYTKNLTFDIYTDSLLDIDRQ